MNSVELFLAFVHYYSPISSIAFVSVMCLAGSVRDWSRERLEIYLIIFSFYLIDVTAFLIATKLPIDISNRWFYNIMQIPQLGVVLFYFSRKLISQRRRKTYTILYYIFFITHISMATFIYGWLQLDVYILVPMTAIVGVVALDYIREMLDDVTHKPLYNPAFWFAIATTISYLGSVPVTSLYFRLEESNMDLALRIWHINDVVYASWFLIITVGLLWTHKQMTPSYS